MKLKGNSGSKPPGSVSALQDQLLLSPIGCPLPQRGQQLTARVSNCHPPHWSTQTLQPLPVFLCHRKDSQGQSSRHVTHFPPTMPPSSSSLIFIFFLLCPRLRGFPSPSCAFQFPRRLLEPGPSTLPFPSLLSSSDS